MLLQASMNPFKKWFTEVVEILKTISYEPAYHWIEGKNVWKKAYTAMFKFFIFWKMTNNFKPVSEISVLVFYAQYLIFWEQWLKEILSGHPQESVEIDDLFYGHHWEEPWLTQISILKRYNNFKCALRHPWKLFAQSTTKFGKVTVARYEFGIKHCLTLKINQFIFIKHFENTNSCHDKNYTFNYMFQNYGVFKHSERALLACACRWRRQGVEMMRSARLFAIAVKPEHSSIESIEVCAGVQPALHFGGAIFMKFHLMTSSCLFNRGTNFSQTSQIKFFRNISEKS